MPGHATRLVPENYLKVSLSLGKVSFRAYQLRCVRDTSIIIMIQLLLRIEIPRCSFIRVKMERACRDPLFRSRPPLVSHSTKFCYKNYTIYVEVSCRTFLESEDTSGSKTLREIRLLRREECEVQYSIYTEFIISRCLRFEFK